MREEWVLEYSDYLAAQKLFNKRSVGRRFYMFAMLWFFPVLAIAFVAFSLWVMYPGPYSWSGLSGTWPLVFVAILFRFSYWRALRKGFKRLFLNGDPTKAIYFSVDEDKVISGVPGSSEAKFEWAAITGFAEDEHIAILYISKRLFLMLPKNKLSVQTWTDMKVILARHLSGVV